jgi:hypothetical protein
MRPTENTNRTPAYAPLRATPNPDAPRYTHLALEQAVDLRATYRLLRYGAADPATKPPGASPPHPRTT